MTMLRLVGGEYQTIICPTCGGKGRVPCPETQAVRTGMSGVNQQGGNVIVPGAGHPIPCPTCNGKKVVTSHL